MKHKQYIISLMLTALLVVPAESFSLSSITDILKTLDDSSIVTVNINGVQAMFRKSTVVENTKKSGAILRGHLLEDVETTQLGQKIAIRAGYVEFHESGNLASCEVTSADLLIGDGSHVKCRLRASFYDDGYLKGTKLPDDCGRTFSIQGRERNLCDVISFHPNGKVEMCTLVNDETFTVGNYSAKFVEGSVVQFSGDDKVIFIDLPENDTMYLVFRGKKIKLEGDVSLNGNGNLKSFYIYDDMNIKHGKYTLTVMDAISFYDDEMIRECFVASAILEHDKKQD